MDYETLRLKSVGSTLRQASEQLLDWCRTRWSSRAEPDPLSPPEPVTVGKTRIAPFQGESRAEFDERVSSFKVDLLCRALADSDPLQAPRAERTRRERTGDVKSLEHVQGTSHPWAVERRRDTTNPDDGPARAGS